MARPTVLHARVGIVILEENKTTRAWDIGREIDGGGERRRVAGIKRSGRKVEETEDNIIPFFFTQLK